MRRGHVRSLFTIVFSVTVLKSRPALIAGTFNGQATHTRFASLVRVVPLDARVLPVLLGEKNFGLNFGGFTGGSGHLGLYRFLHQRRPPRWIHFYAPVAISSLCLRIRKDKSLRTLLSPPLSRTLPAGSNSLDPVRQRRMPSHVTVDVDF